MRTKWSNSHRTTTLSLLPHPAPTVISTLSLHDALPISEDRAALFEPFSRAVTVQNAAQRGWGLGLTLDRKSTRLNSSHVEISYAVFCLKKKSFITTMYRHAGSSSR